MNPVAIVQADADGKIALWGTGAEALFGYKAAQAVGQSLDMLVPPHYREHHWKGFKAAMANRALQGNEPFLLPIVCSDGKTKHFAGRLHVLNNAYGESVGALAIFVAERTGAGVPDLYRLE